MRDLQETKIGTQVMINKHAQENQANEQPGASGRVMLAVHDVAKKNHWEPASRQLGPCRPEEFLPDVERFIRDDLTKVLNSEAKAKLKKAEGTWPDYPQLVMELAQKNKLKVPLTYLPDVAGQADFWNKLPKEK